MAGGWEVVNRRKAGGDPWAVVNRAPVEKPPMWRGVTASFGQGLSLGTADEVQAGLEALSSDTTYKDSMVRQQAERDAFAAEHPFISGTATAAGAALPVLASLFAGPATGGAVPVATTATAANMVRNAFLGRAFPAANTTGQAIAQGARYGAAFGGPTGYASADPYGDWGGLSRTVGAAGGMAGSAVLGAAIPAAGALAADTRRRLVRFGDWAGPKVQQLAEAMGVQTGPPGASVARPSSIQATSGARGGEPPATGAEAKILRALEEGGTNPEAAALALEEARKAGVPLSLMDVGGQPTLRLARGVRTLPGAGSAQVDAALEARAAGQPERVREAVQTGLGVPMSGNSGATLDDLLELARRRSEPLYGALRQIPVSDPQIAEMLQQPGARDILVRLQRTRAAFPTEGAPTVPPLFADDGTMLRQPTLADVNDVNVTLNEMMRPQYQRMGGRPIEGADLLTSEGRALARDFQRRLNRLADDMLGGDWYSVARQTYSGPADARTHYERGLNFTKPSTELEDVVAQTSATTPTQQGWYRRGIADSIDQKIGALPDLGGRPNVLRGFWNNPNARAKFEQSLLPEQRADTLRRLELENLAAQNSNFVRSGSQTADKAAEAMDVALDVGETVAAGANPKGAAVRLVWDRVRGKFSAQQREEIASALTTIDPAKHAAILERLVRLQEAGRLRAGSIGATVRAITAQQLTE